MSVEELIAKAQEEILKLQHTKIDTVTSTVVFADKVLKQLIELTIRDNIFDESVETGVLMISDGIDKYKMYLDIVDKDYMLDLGPFKNNGKIQEVIIFLLNSVKTLFCPLKDYMKEWAIDNDTDFSYVLQIGLNTTMFLDKDCQKRIGIILLKTD